MKYPSKKTAVALEYGSKSAPTLLAKGHEATAEKIIAEAQKQGIFIAEDPQLVALLSQLELDQQIPENLYVAVAVILSWVYWLRGMTPDEVV
jgi:flagellar biosynthesis protein